MFDGIFIRKQHKTKQTHSHNDTMSSISGILTAYVDDLMILSENPVKDLNEIAKRIKCSDLQ